MIKPSFAGRTSGQNTGDAEKIRKLEQLEIRPAVTVYKVTGK